MEGIRLFGDYFRIQQLFICQAMESQIDVKKGVNVLDFIRGNVCVKEKEVRVVIVVVVVVILIWGLRQVVFFEVRVILRFFVCIEIFCIYVYMLLLFKIFKFYCYYVVIFCLSFCDFNKRWVLVLWKIRLGGLEFFLVQGKRLEIVFYIYLVFCFIFFVFLFVKVLVEVI